MFFRLVRFWEVIITENTLASQRMTVLSSFYNVYLSDFIPSLVSLLSNFLICQHFTLRSSFHTQFKWLYPLAILQTHLTFATHALRGDRLWSMNVAEMRSALAFAPRLSHVHLYAALCWTQWLVRIKTVSKLGDQPFFLGGGRLFFTCFCLFFKRI